MLITGNQPPKNKVDTKALIRSILAYSPRKNKAKVIAEYSTLYPETNSASASGKTNGDLLVSAKIDIKKGQEKKSALAVARGIQVKEIKKAEKAKKCKITLTKVRIG